MSSFKSLIFNNTPSGFFVIIFLTNITYMNEPISWIICPKMLCGQSDTHYKSLLKQAQKSIKCW